MFLTEDVDCILTVKIKFSAGSNYQHTINIFNSLRAQNFAFTLTHNSNQYIAAVTITDLLLMQTPKQSSPKC